MKTVIIIAALAGAAYAAYRYRATIKAFVLNIIAKIKGQ